MARQLPNKNVSTKPRVLRVSHLTRVPIKQIIETGFSKIIGNNKITLNHVIGGIELVINNFPANKIFPLYEKPIRGRLQRSGRIPWDNNIQYYVVGADGKRRRFLYLSPASIGTISDFPAAYDSTCRSRKQRKHYQECTIRNRRKKQRQARKLQRRLEAYRLKLMGE